MRNDKKIGVWSMILVALNLSLAKYLLLVPSFIVQEVGNSAWIVTILKGVASVVIFAVVSVLYRPYVEMGLGELACCSTGRFIGGVINAVLAGLIIARSAFLYRTISEALRTLEVANSSPEFIAMFILIPVVVCALKGFNANVNISIIIIPFTIISVAILALVLTPHFRLNNIMPILGEGPKEIFVSAAAKYGCSFEILILLIFSKYMSGHKTFRKSGYIGLGAIALVTTVFTLMYCAAIPYPASKDFFFPLYQLSRLILANAFMQHMEPLVVFIWAGIVLCALATMVLGAAELMASSAGVKDTSGFVPLLAMSVFFVGMLPQSEISTYDFYRSTINISNYVFLLVIFVILIIARGRKIEKA